MKTNQRYSPVSFLSEPDQTEMRNGWKVVLKYKDEATGPFLIDLSHRKRLDVQDSNLSKFQPGGVTIPETPGLCAFQNGILINRMNRTQATVWHLLGDSPDMTQETTYTEVTEGSIFLALLGSASEVFSIMEKVTSLDLRQTANEPPFLIQGPIFHVPCQIVVFDEKEKGSAILFTCSRGYGTSMAQELLETGAEYGLRPAGEKAFSECLSKSSFCGSRSSDKKDT
ncbi:MAG: sarcosine oxidase subunit gamma SoxG [Proteobacteria bacterium]|nr:sarcosine oxidase subunit gamma SoxG [Pseudomonadota bacterium]